MNDGRRSATSTDELPPRSEWEPIAPQRFQDTPLVELPWYTRHPEDSAWPWRLLYVGLPLLVIGVLAVWWVILR